jgi:membrane fusion protein (multidrug efflux system)
VREGLNDRAILIPQQAVTRDPKGNPTALVVNPNEVVELRMLKLDRAIGNQWLVSGGLVSGDRVICEGMQRIRPGSTVKAVPLTTGQKTADKTEKGSSKEQGRQDGGS